MLSAACDFPRSSRLREFLPGYTYPDSFCVPASRPDLPIEDIYIAALGHLPHWFKRLLVLRTQIVAPFGVRGPTMAQLNAGRDPNARYAVGGEILRWTIHDLTADEIIAGGDDKHLDFRVSVLRNRETEPASIILSTAVRTRNRFGKAYMAAIKPFHRFGVKTLLSNAAAAARL